MFRLSVGTTTLISDVIKVAHGTSIELESTNRTMPLPPMEAPSSHLEEKQTLSVKATRAIAFIRLMTLMRSKTSVNPLVLTKLHSFLNGRSCPLPISDQDSTLLQSMMDMLYKPEELTTSDKAVFISGSSASAGIAVLNVHYGSMLMETVNSLVSLSSEVLSADTKACDPLRLESHSGKNAIDVAMKLKTILTGSRRINKAHGVGAVNGISDIPIIHGAVLDALKDCQDALRIELNAQALDAKAIQEFPYEISPSFQIKLEVLTRSFVEPIECSIKRIKLLLDKLPSLSPLNPALNEEQMSVEQLKLMQDQGSNKLESIKERVKDDKKYLQGLILGFEEVKPSAGIATLGSKILQLMSEALSLECSVILISLRILEGPSIPTPLTDDTAGDAPVKKDKKKKGQGLHLGQANISIKNHLEHQLMRHAEQDNAQTLSSTHFLTLPWPIHLQLDQVVNSATQMFDLEEGEVRSLAEMVQHEYEKYQVKGKPKVPKGSRDFLPEQMRIREEVLEKITSVFKRHGAVSIDTPIFELKETLTGKYGEDSKLIYDLADQGGELLSLRYDLTVPFARFVALHSVGNIKRYHIGKVYRRDQPQMTRGRFREFFQCDFDIAGTYATMVPDAECVKVLVEILGELQLGDFEVKVNHRQLIDAMMEICGVPASKHRSICSAIDKLDKESWERVKEEMVEEKGLLPEVANKLGEFVQIRDAPDEFIDRLTEPAHPFMQNAQAKNALEELQKLVEFLKHLEALDHIVFDLSLARGLDYYSGLIYEAVYKDATTGSVAAGGRYDKLVGMFSGKDVPAVGVSIGVERVFSIMEDQRKQEALADGSVIRSNDTQVLIASIGNGLQGHRMRLCAQLWAGGIAAEFGYKPNPKMGDQLNHALAEGIPYMVLFGEDELKDGLVKLKDLNARIEDSIGEDKLVSEIKSRISEVQDIRELAYSRY